MSRDQGKVQAKNRVDCNIAADVEDVTDGLIWWYERHAMFPQLSRMARNYLSIPGEFFFFFAFTLGAETCIP